MITTKERLELMLADAGIPVDAIHSISAQYPNPDVLLITYAAGATSEQIAQGELILNVEMPAAIAAEAAAAQQEQQAREAVAFQGIQVPGVPAPLFATPIDWQYYTNLLGVCMSRKATADRKRSATLLIELQAMTNPTAAEVLAKLIELVGFLANGDAGEYERPCKIATKEGSFTYMTTLDAIDGALVYSDESQTLWEALLP
ncbi:MAG: hypothetical protein ACAI35_04385 [Candidatus Methylacidiphilales bacterium]